MPRFTNSEKTDMVIIFGECRGNAREALALYMKKHKNRTKPSSSTFLNLVNNLRNYGAFQKPDRKPRCNRIAGNENTEKKAFALVHQNPLTSSRAAAKQLGCSHATILKIWNQHKLHFSVDRFINDPQLIKFYTGFRDYSTLNALFKALEPMTKKMLQWDKIKKSDACSESADVSSKSEKIPMIDQFFLFLLRIRRGWTSKDLAIHFKVSIPIVNNVIVSWTNFLFFVLGSFPLWMSKEMNLRQMPDVFKKSSFCNTRVIVYIQEIKVKKTHFKRTDEDTVYSLDKEHFLFKSLYAMSPCGALVFTSSLFPGNMSDRELTIRSGLLQNLEPHDEVMFDKEFPIADVLAKKGVKLNYPPIIHHFSQHYPPPEKEAQEMTILKSHINKIKQRLKEYQVFDIELNLNLTGAIHQLWAICCILTNFQGPEIESLESG